MNKKQIITIAILVIIVGAGMFFAGTKWEAKKLTAQFEKEKIVSSQNSPLNRPNRPDTASGEITAKDDASFMVKMADGSLKKVMFSDKTMVRKTDTVKVSDLNVGEQVNVAGKNKDEGEIEAQSISVVPSTQSAQ